MVGNTINDGKTSGGQIRESKWLMRDGGYSEL